MISDNHLSRGSALSIGIGMTMLALFLVGVARAEGSYEFLAKWQSVDVDHYFWHPTRVTVDSGGNVYVAD